MLDLRELPSHVARAIEARRVHLEECRSRAGLYTVGLSRLQGHPEILVRALDDELYAKVTSVLVSHVLAGVRYHPGTFEVLGMPARMVALTQAEIAQHMPMFSAAASHPPAALQIVLAENGQWPWDAGGPAGDLLAFPPWRLKGDA